MRGRNKISLSTKKEGETTGIRLVVLLVLIVSTTLEGVGTKMIHRNPNGESVLKMGETSNYCTRSSSNNRRESTYLLVGETLE